MANRLLIVLVVILSIVSAASITALTSKNSGTGNVDEERVKEIVYEFLSSSPDVIVNAFNDARAAQESQQNKQAEKQISKNITLLENDPRTPVIGNPDGDVTIVKFSDYNCGYCKRVAPDLIKLLEEDKDVKLVVKDFPILGERSVINSQAAMAVYALDKSKYENFHLEMLKRTPRNDEQLFALAKKEGIDPDALSAEMQKPRYDLQVEETMKLANEIGIRGTPAFIIGGEYIPGAISYEQLKEKVAAARARS